MKVYRSQNGFTLVELLVVLMIMGTTVAFFVSMMGGTTSSKIKETSNHLIRIIRYVYHQSALTQEYYRIVFDLDEQLYYVESSVEPFYVVREGDEQEKLRLENEEDAATGVEDDEDLEAIGAVAGEGQFGESEDDSLEIYKLPGGVKIAGIQVFHNKERQEEGQSYLYFFPKGYTELAVIQVSDDDEGDVMSLLVHPLTGRVDVRGEDIDYEEALEQLSTGT